MCLAKGVGFSQNVFIKKDKMTTNNNVSGKWGLRRNLAWAGQADWGK